MKNLLPLFTIILLLSSCEGFFELFNDPNNDKPAIESICEVLENDDLTEKELLSLAYSINPDIVDLSEIESIEYTFTFSNGGTNVTSTILNTNDAIVETEIDTVFSSRNSISRNIIIKPNRINLNEEGGTPIDVAEIILDMPGTGTVKVEDIIEFEDNNCCNTISAAITNVIVSLKGGVERNIKLPGCYKIIDIGKCCDLELK